MSSPATKVTKTPAGKPSVEAEPAPPEHEEIALLAYMYWEARGRPADSPEEDWLRAEEEIRRQAATG